MFKFDFDKQENTTKKTQGFQFDFSLIKESGVPKTFMDLPTKKAAGDVRDIIDRDQYDANVRSTYSERKATARKQGLITGQDLDTGYGRTKTEAAETDLDALKKDLDSKKKTMDSASYDWNMKGASGGSLDNYFVYENAKKAYDEAQTKYNDALKVSDTNKRAETIEQLESVKNTGKKSLLEELSTGTQSFEQIAKQGRAEKVGVLAAIPIPGKDIAGTIADINSDLVVDKYSYPTAMYMTDDEKDVYAYYMKTNETKAGEYLKALSPALNYRSQTDIDTNIANRSAENAGYGVIKNLQGSYLSPLALVGTGLHVLKDKVNGTDTPLDTNSEWFSGAHASEASSEGIKSNVPSSLGKFAVDTGLSMVQFASTIPLGETAALALLSSSAGGQMSYSVAERGGSAEQALKMGVVAAAAELVTEKMSFDSLFKIYKAGGAGYKSAFRQTLGNISKQTGTEALEEMTSQYIDNIGDEVIMGNNSQMNTYIKQLKEQGLSEEEAFRKAFVQYFVTDPLINAAGGALSGGIMGAGGSIAANINENTKSSQTGAELRRTWGKDYSAAVRELVATGQEYSENTPARYYADEAANVLEAGRQLTDEQAGRLYQANLETQNAEAEAYFKGDNTKNQIMRKTDDGYTVLPTAAELSEYSLRQTQNKYAEQLAASLRKYNVKGVVVENMPEGVTGRWENGVVYVSSSLDTAAAINSKVAHEISHAAQESDTAFTNDILDAMSESGTDVNAAIAKKKQIYSDYFKSRGMSEADIAAKVTDAYAADEVTADYIGELMQNDSLIQSLSKKPTLIRRIIDAISRLLGRSKSASERAAYTELAGKLRKVAGASQTSDVGALPMVENGVRFAVEAQSIKQQIAENQDDLNNMNPVANITSDGMKGLTKQQQLVKVMENLNNTGFEVDRQDFGKIIFDKKRLHDSLNYAHTDAERAAFAAIPLVLKRGTEITGHGDHKKRGYPTVTIAAPIVLNEQRGNMAVVVKMMGRNFYKTHRLLTPDGEMFVLSDIGDAESTISGGLTANIDPQATPINSAPKNSIAEDTVKSKSEKENIGGNGGTRYSLADEETVVPWEETEEQAQKAGYPVIDGRQVFPYRTWVRDRERGNYGLVVGLGADGGLNVSFWNKDQGARARVELPAEQLSIVDGQYQPSDAELAALFQTEPAESLRNAVSAEDWQEYRGIWDEAQGFKPGMVVSLDVAELPAKAQSYLTREENRLAGRIAKLMDVPQQARRDFLKPVVQEISKEYLNTGGVSDKTIESLFNKAWDEGVIVNDEFYEQYKQLKNEMKDTAVTLSEADSKDISDYGDWVKHQFGRLKIVKESGVPVDVRYAELADSYPGLFPESITHPADQLRHMSEIAKSIVKTEESHDKYYGSAAEFYKNAAMHDFETLMMNYLPELKTVRKYYEQRARYEQEREKTLAFAGMELDESAVNTIKTLWKFEKDAKKKVEKATARNLMTERDNITVDKLLTGELTLDTLPGNINIKGVREVYEARSEYEQLMGLVREFNKNRKSALRHEADGYLKDALNWKDKPSGIRYMRETMERNIHDIVKDKATADKINQRYFEPVHTHEAERNVLKNLYRDRVRQMQLSRKVEKGNKLSEAAAVQIYGEAIDNIEVLESQKAKKAGDDWRNGYTLTEWKAMLDDIAANNPNLDMQKMKDAAEEFRSIYNELFEQMNDARIRNGYEPVDYRRGYFPHFKDDVDIEGSDKAILAQFGKALGITMDVTELPTSINGLTYKFRPGVTWQGSALQREGFDTSYDAVQGFDKYIEGVSDVICHTDDIQSLRALADQIRYRSTDAGVREQIDNLREDKALSMEERENEITKVYALAKFNLKNLIINLDEYTNLLANKKSRLDREPETVWGRWFYNVAQWFENRVAGNMVAVNPATWLTNFIPLVQGGSMLKSGELLGAMWDTLKAYKEDDGFSSCSDFLINRRGSDPLVRTWTQQASATLSTPMEYIDTFTADSLVRARYRHNRTAGMSEAFSMREADSWAAGIMADRSKGSMPTVFSAHSPGWKALTQFQLEVNNQLSWLFKDMPNDANEKGTTALAVMLLKFFLGSWLYNEIYEYFIGRRPALDPIGILNETVGDVTGYQLPNTLEMLTGTIKGKTPNFTTEKKTLGGAEENLAKNILQELPFIGGTLGGGRLPIANAFPDVTKINTARANLISGEGSARKNWNVIGDELLSPAAYILPPFGGGQLKKVYQGIKAVIESGKYSVDSEGRDILQYPVYNDNLLMMGINAAQAAAFGPTALKTGQDWIKGGFKSMGAAQTAVYKELVASGTSERAAYDVIKEIAGTEGKNKGTRFETTKTSEQRKVLDGSNLTADEKNIIYYGLLASDNERAVMEKLDEMGAKSTETSKTLAAIQNIGSSNDVIKPNTKTANMSRTEKKVNALLATDMTDEQKRIIYTAMISDSETAEKRITTCMNSGLSFNDFLKVQNTFAKIDNDDNLKAASKAIRFIGELNDAGYSTAQIGNIGSTFLFRASMASTNALEDFVDLTGAGVSGTNASLVLDALEELEPLSGKEQVSDMQKMKQVAEMPFSEADKLATMQTILDEKSYAKIEIASSYGVKVAGYVNFKDILPNFDADKNGSYKYAEVEGALNSLSGLTNDQRAVLWQIQIGGKNNPYNSAIGAKIKSTLAALKEEQATTSTGTGGFTFDFSSGASATPAAQSAGSQGGGGFEFKF